MEKKSFFGWPLTVILGIMYFCSSGFVLAAAQIINPMMMQDPSMGLSGTLLGTGFSLFVLMQGIPSPLVGWLIGKKGARFTMICGGIIMLLSALCMVFVVRDAITYFIVFGVFLSVSTIMAGQISVQSTVGEWFIAKRGSAMSVMMGIGGLSSFVAPLAVNAVISSSGGAWQSGWYLLIGLAVVLILLAAFLVKNKPADINQLPDGGADIKAQAQGGKGSKVYKNTGAVKYSEAVKTPYFWLIAVAGSGGFCAFSLATSQGIINFTSLGFDTGVIVGAAAVMGIASLLGKLITGFFADYLEPSRILGIALIVLVIGVLCGAYAANPIMIYIYYICTGVGFGTIATNLPTTVANYFGTTAFSKNLSTVMLTTTIISSIIPIMAGALFDASGNCTIAFLVTAGIVAVCAVCAFLVRVPKTDVAADTAADE